MASLGPLDPLIRFIEYLVLEQPFGALFNTYAFILLFLPIALTGYWVLAAWPRLRLGWLVTMSLLFYSFYDVRFTALLLGAALVDFLIALRIGAAVGDRRKMWLAASVTFNLTLLFFFKYAGFAVDSAQSLLHALGVPGELPAFNIVLPVGISFFTFKTMSYTIEVYRGDVQPTRSLLKYTAFISLFPEMVAGPIVRYEVLDRQLDDLPRRLPGPDVVAAVSLFSIGLFKKVVIADTIAATVDPLWAVPGALSTAQAWVAAIGYTFQLYFDFSGYSDMAIGLALMLGLRFPINFRAPYQALNPSDFWRRWHITLSTFLRDYLYIPLGGNRGTGLQVNSNLMITMILGGLWHGAAWTFVLWGLYHGFLLVLYRRVQPFWDRRNVWLQRSATFLLVVFGWVLFRAASLGDAFTVYGAMFVPVGGLAGVEPIVGLAGAALLAFVWLVRPTSDRVFPMTSRWAILVGIMFAAGFVLMGNQESPFLYYQF
ncbi:MAG: MBOAT family protein [Candidatus Thermoplasmatota archaeon]